MIKLTIDSKEVTAKENQTVLQVALESGIDIPHLCYHPTLSPFAGCRLCIVEVKGGKAPMASCALPVKDGMEVIAHNEKLHQMRKTVLDLIISDHQLNCLTCEKNGVCDLQKYAYEFGIEKTSFDGERTSYAPEIDNPLIQMSYQMCIMCGRCVTACNEAVVNEAIDFTKRGFATKITTSLDIPRKDSDCVFCGACVDVCPVGALTDLTARFKGRLTDCQKVSVICPYCGCGCSIILDIKDNRIVRARGNPNGPANKGYLCIKGHFGMDFVRHVERLASCVVRQDTKHTTHNIQRTTDLPAYPSSALDESLNQSRERLHKPLIRKDGVLT
ncbi:MAG: 2Fe-2S iron-sulfur cluster-binding protein, partial [Planctomycetota bacterium]|nr:2Fe-2S iron-sulfur cluster-binding protein [Planctomycetota bacterium]